MAKYISTRGEAPSLSFTDTLMAGLASDGGLYLPEIYPELSKDEIAAFAGLSYAEVAEAIFSRFIGPEIDPKLLKSMIEAAYASFRHKAVAPLAQIGDQLFLLELFHGPTLAFKDVAMQILARLTDHVLKARRQHATVVGADVRRHGCRCDRGLSRPWPGRCLHPLSVWPGLGCSAPPDDLRGG